LHATNGSAAADYEIADAADIAPHPGEPLADSAAPTAEFAVAIPNAPSGPVWSLSHDQTSVPHEHSDSKTHIASVASSESIGGRPIEQTPTTNSNAEPILPSPKLDAVEETVVVEAKVAATEERKPQQPPRRGWWQRPFRARDEE
jgi:hypothetical protein